MENEDKIRPLQYQISFGKLLKEYERLSKGNDKILAERAKQILDAQKPYPILREGFADFELLEEHKEVISLMLQDSFSPILGENEIKVASIPYFDFFFNPSKRFQNIVKEAGPNFKPKIRNQEKGIDYIMGCTVILKFHYGVELDFSRPYFYDIPDSNGVMRHYRIMYNADFMEILPTERSKELSQEDIDELMESPDNLSLWKEKIPPDSFVAKGFIISNMFDVTSEHSISEIKSNLIASDKRSSESFMSNLQETFRSFFRLPGIKVGFVVYNSKKDQFEPVYGKDMGSFILNGQDSKSCHEALCQYSYKKLIKENSYFAIPDVAKYDEKSHGSDPYHVLEDQNIKSAILAPIAFEGELLGVLEVVSGRKNELNGVNARKLNDVMPYIVSAVVRSKVEEENLIDAIIQNECTSVHSSVYWRFQEEAKFFIKDQLESRSPSFKEIVFKDVYPLYGQIDIKDSSKARNKAIQRDLMIQLSQINVVLELALGKNRLPIYEELVYRVNNHLESIKEMLYTNSEQAIFDFVKEEIDPVFAHLKDSDTEIAKHIQTYEAKIDMGTGSYYDHRKNYDESVTMINKKLVSVLDKKQENAQAMFPHYFERYKTDGVEHNMYIGASISENGGFNSLYLNNLRLWQLQVMCEMENVHYKLKPELPIPLNATSLILVYSSSLSIRFRMDEKKFDVDGTYNARYEVIKKRIDKAYIKGTEERLTQTGKIAIVYSQKKDELEYLRYIKFLKSKNYFTDKIEIVELEGLQGVSGLKAIRAEILYKKDQESQESYTYEDLMATLKE
ncbi:GAF domain-containing protein [Maribacter sp. PR1]|uniref:GAF domain-containing protein n=1 Tax=Maribacter cobaltidurans TaxID=1178778 RepID=A0ABU7IRQ4_9FLAO|nr:MULTISPECIES: GAF domain-containing protein [Maribacter]MDC6388264.1 GAF domain-containing protein [Maribacter sp. PR1]MEE1975652.1 GAF domain-containing protein [Maribacter cobaltidurans]